MIGPYYVKTSKGILRRIQGTGLPYEALAKYGCSSCVQEVHDIIKQQIKS